MLVLSLGGKRSWWSVHLPLRRSRRSWPNLQTIHVTRIYCLIGFWGNVWIDFRCGQSAISNRSMIERMRRSSSALQYLCYQKIWFGKGRYKNFLPIWNPSFISKPVEKILTRSIDEHQQMNDLRDTYQSDYCKAHWTETAQVKIHSDIT